jgi:predicted aspartyl protease
MPRYDDTHYDEPAPVALVTILNKDTGQLIAEVPMLIDTGADQTLIPKSVADLLGLPHLETYSVLEGFDGSRSEAQAVSCIVKFLNGTFEGRYLVLATQDCGILGRNILKYFRLIMDGPQQSWDRVHAESS